jgi:hypothetical protein
MKPFILLVSFCLFAGILYSQQGYWQQQVNYDISVNLDDKKHILDGRLDLKYKNNSPDTLSFIWFHLWPNAYSGTNTALAKQLKEKRMHRQF